MKCFFLSKENFLESKRKTRYSKNDFLFIYLFIYFNLLQNITLTSDTLLKAPTQTLTLFKTKIVNFTTLF